MLLAKLQISKSGAIIQTCKFRSSRSCTTSCGQQSRFPQLATAVPNHILPWLHQMPFRLLNRTITLLTDSSRQQYQIPSPVQNQQQGPPAPQQHQYQPSPALLYPQHPSIVGNSGPQYQPSSAPMGHRSDESSYVPPQTYPSNLYQPAAQPSRGPSPTQSFYGKTSSMYEPPSEPFSYGGPTLHYGGGAPVNHSHMRHEVVLVVILISLLLEFYPQIYQWLLGGSVVDQVPEVETRYPLMMVDRVTNIGFSRDQVRAKVRRLTDNGQSVNLNVVFGKLLNDADVRPPKGWFGR